ncbi:hemolysin precursor [mine drainage metagenome]|uniref:Hemolysin n=1 Tax=mine drainage metagenome TaxID=410659 RepID=A0A1J5QEW0_9ZZZZ
MLNNAVGAARSELLGDIAANARLNGRAAQLIINQVLGDDPSTLRGMLEVVGARADVIVANPHGITCDGCGFIGAGRATLLVGDAQLDGAHGPLRTLSAADGDLRIRGLGLRDHARAAERIDLIARRIAVAGRVDARELRLIAGANQVDAASGDVQGLADAVAAQVGYSLDVAEAGAMHAGRIHLITTEAGAGVRSAGELRAHTQDLRLDVAGELKLERASAQRDVVIAADGPVDVGISLDAERDITLRGAKLANRGAIAAEGTLKIEVKELRNAGGTLRAGRGVQLRSGFELLNTNQGSIVAGGELHARVATHLTNHGKIEGRSMRLELGGTLHNAAASLSSTQGDLDIDALAMDNTSGSVNAATALRVRLADTGWLYNADGSIKSGTGATVLSTGKFGNARGAIEVGGDLQLRASSLANPGGRIAADGAAQIDCGEKFDNSSALLKVRRGLTLRVGGAVANEYGMIAAGEDLQVALGAKLSNLGGRVEALQGELHLHGPDASIDNGGGDIAAGSVLRIEATRLKNGGQARMIGDDVSLRVGKLANTDGRIAAQRKLRIDASAIDNRDGGRIVAGDTAELDIENVLRNGGGRIKVRGDELVLRAPRGEIDNRNGKLRIPFGQLRCNAEIVQGELRSAQP